MRMTLRIPSSGSVPEMDREQVTSKRVPTNLSLPEDLVAALDEVAGPRNRSAFAEAAIRREIRRHRFYLVGKQLAGSLDPDDYPHWQSSEDVVAWVREIRAEETDPGD